MAFLLVDDSVQDKRYSRFIEGPKRQYSGAVHGGHNALKFTRRGGVTVRAGLAPEPAAAGHVTLRFEVTDTGIGIPMDKLGAIAIRTYAVRWLSS